LLAESGEQALQLLRKQVVAAVVCDYEMPGMNGGELAAEVKRSRPRMPVLLISGHESVLDDPPQSVDCTLEKGVPLNRLLEAVEHLCLSSSPRPVHMSDLRPLAPLGQALAGVAVAAFLLPRILK
jgi:CheY-like chemotaxis protein